MSLFTASLITLASLLSRVHCLCSVKELTTRTRGQVAGFGPPGKFRATTSGDLFSLPRGEVELREGGMYQCNKRDKWNKIPKLVGVYYKLYTVPAQPEHADSVCEEEGGVLATVYNTRLNNVMAAVMRGSEVEVALIGITDLEKEGEWVWTSGLRAPDGHVQRNYAGGQDYIPGRDLIFTM